MKFEVVRMTSVDGVLAGLGNNVSLAVAGA
jgi:hypothetical protein